MRLPDSYRFGPFLVDRVAYRVMRGSQTVELTPKLLDLLLHLLDHAGALVTKEALLDALWPGANVTDNALTQAISELRQALGDEPTHSRFIKTIARRGYRFIGAIDPPEVGGDVRTPAPEADAVVAEAIPMDERAIAVLDFTNVTGDADSAWLSAGIAETVCADLQALGRHRVLDRRRVTEAARQTGGALREVAAALGVRLAVVGSFQCSGDRIRITARIVDVVNGDAVADAKVDGRLDAIFELQDQVAAQFARELGAPGPLPVGAVRSRETASLEAYRAATEGWLRVETLDIRELPAAIADFERAVAVDPRYALAYTGLATAEFASYESTRCDEEPAQDRLERAIAHGRDAVRLDDSLAEAHGALALILVSHWDTASAIRSARRAVALEPGNWRHLFRLGHACWGDERLRAGAATLSLYPDFAFAYFQSAMVHVARGHLAEAEGVLRHGAAVQDRQIGRSERYPALGLHWLLGLVRLTQHDVGEAMEEFDREARLAEAHRLYGREYAMLAQLGRGAALVEAGDAQQAVACCRAALESYPDYPQAHLTLARALRAAGTADEADAAIARAERASAILAGSRPLEATIARGLILIAKGLAHASAVLLGRMLDEAPPGFAGWVLPVDPLFRPEVRATELTGVLARLGARAG